MSDFVNKTCTEFSEQLASSAPIPGGGGAAALVGALGAALASMVSNLTIGKKKYAAYEDDLKKLLEKSEAIRKELLSLVDKDAEAFEPLSKAYSIPKDNPDREKIMEDCLRLACTVPMDILRAADKAALLLPELVEKGSSYAVSDVGCAAACCKAAAQSACLNVYINTKLMNDRDYAAALEKEAEELVQRCSSTADEAYNSVLVKLK